MVPVVAVEGKQMRLTDIPAPSLFEGMNNLRYDYDVCYAYDQKWELYGLHCHDFYELYIHFGGAKFYSVNNAVYPLKPDQLIVIPPFCMHGILGESAPTNYERAFVYMMPSTLRACGGGYIDLEQFMLKYVQGEKYIFQLSHEDAMACKGLLQEAAKNLQSTSSMVRYDNYVKVITFLSTICNTMNRSEALAEPVSGNGVIHNVLSYINDHFTLPLKLEGLARQFGVSVSFLSHEFVKYTGRSVYDYILHRRVMKAKSLISSACPLNEVSYQCGFNDYSSFLRIFSKMAGMSPSAYRKLKMNVTSET